MSNGSSSDQGGSQSKGKIHDIFQKNIEGLATQGGEQGDAIRGTGFRPWNRPDQTTSDTRAARSMDPRDAAGMDPLDIAGITDGYNRDEIDTNYGELIQSGEDAGTCGDVIAVKTQADYVAMQERGYRARNATPVRCIGHAMARRKGHSNDAGVFLGGVLKHVQSAIKAGQG
jgi:hypothetical protein